MNEDDPIEHEKRFAIPAELQVAIGGVVYQTALVDALAREILMHLGPESDTYSWLFEGHTSEWLLDSCGVLLHEVDPVSSVWPAHVHEAFKAQLEALKRLRPLRNAVVHGVWLSDSGDDDIIPRPWKGQDIGDVSNVLYCFRSRFKKYAEVRAFTVDDVNLIATRLACERSRLVDVCRLMERMRDDTPWRWNYFRW